MSAISAEERYSKKSLPVLDRAMRYVDEGEGSPIVFLHGNPTSSYLWRNVIPHVTELGRCIAPDLIGMGDSDKLAASGPEAYSYFDHRSYLDAFLVNLGVTQDVSFVIHDWGSALGFDWAQRHIGAVRCIAYMEAIVCPLTWQDWPEAARDIFQGFRSPGGENMILEKNLFVEAVLPNAIMRKLTDAEMDVYRRPYLNPGEDRRPTLAWPRQIPIDDEPPDVTALVRGYGEWLSTCETPKLFVNADPGSILVSRPREFCRSWRNQQEVTVTGRHFVQEDSPDEIGRAVASFIARHTRS